MKHHHSWAWAFGALAVLASPLTLDKVVTHLNSDLAYRSIATLEAEPETPHKKDPLQKAQRQSGNGKNQQEPQAQARRGGGGSPELEPTEPVDPAGEASTEVTQQAGGDVAGSLGGGAQAEASSETSSEAEAEPSTETSVAEAEPATETSVAEAEPATETSVAEAEPSTETSVAEAEPATEGAAAPAQDSEELRRRNERIAELERRQRETDLLVCRAEERNTALNAQITQLNQQQQQFTQVMLGLNQMLIMMFMQQNQQPSVTGGPNYFQTPQNPYAMGQLTSPVQHVIMGGLYPFNPWMSQPQTIINNYAGGMSPQYMPQTGFMGGQQSVAAPMSMMMQQQPQFMPYQQSNYGFGPLIDDSSRGVFGSFQPMGFSG